MNRTTFTRITAMGFSSLLMAAGLFSTATAAGLDIHYDRSAVPAVELTGPRVARPDALQEAEFAAFKAEEMRTPAPRFGEIHSDRSAVPAVEWTGAQVARPDR
jgi:hypothetical protein